jgi:hypothetical protein
VGLSLHLQVVLSHPDVRGLARITLTNFFAVLLISLFALIPAGHPFSTGVEMLAVALGGLALMARTVGSSIRLRSQERTLRGRLLLLRFGLSAVAYLVAGVSAVLLLVDLPDDGLGWLVSSIVVLLLTAVRNTWDLLVTVGEHRIGTTSQVDDPPAAAG